VTTETRPLTGWRPSPLMVRILSAFVILATSSARSTPGTWRLCAGRIAGRPGLVGVSRPVRAWARAPSWLLFPGAFIYSGPCSGSGRRPRPLARAGRRATAFLFVPGAVRASGGGRWGWRALYIGIPFNYYLVLYTSQPPGMVWALFIIFTSLPATRLLLVGSQSAELVLSSVSPRRLWRGDRRCHRIGDRDDDRSLCRHGLPLIHAIVLASVVSARSSATWSSRR
jgi:hypothetical protein